MAETRTQSSGATLARWGFTDPSTAQRLLESAVLHDLPDERTGLTAALAHTADPDRALLALVRLLEQAEAAGDAVRIADLRACLANHSPQRDRLVGVLGGSTALGDHLAAHPEHWLEAAYADTPDAAERTRRMREAVSADARGEVAAYDALRVAYRAQLLAIVAIDLTTPDPMAHVAYAAACLADLASAALEASLDIAAQEHPDAAELCRLAVMGMGKTGGSELNYVSDVDVIFVAEAVDGVDDDTAAAAATTLAGAMMKACSASTKEGTLWPVDAALRPEGKQGPLVRTVASHRQYYQRWAKTWEFQALLKARPVAGDRDLAQDYLDAIAPMVWEAAGRENFVEDVQAMRRRVEAHVPASEAKRQLKLGPGGLRDIEFSVQLLQLVHGRVDESLRSRTTLEALAALAAGGYVARDDAAELDASYRLLRTLEHRIQMHRMRRTHLMPTAQAELRRLGRSLGYRADPDKEVVATWQQHAREVRRIHERLFYRPLLSAAARLGADAASLTDDAARARLAALGFRDPAGALRHIGALTSGYSRTAAMQRTLLPIMLGWFADEADPDAGLLAFRRISDSLGSTHWYLKMLRDSGHAAERLAHVLARSRFVADLLENSPESVSLFGDDDSLVPRTREQLLATMRAAIKRKDDAEEALNAIRVIRRQELLRVAIADVLGLVDLDTAGVALTDLTEALLEGALYIATVRVATEKGIEVPADIAIVGMGRLGGRECGYASDADILVVHRPRDYVDDGDHTAYQFVVAVVQEVRRMLGTPGPDPKLDVDIDLRPEGKAGPLSRTLEGYEAYYARWSVTWESQALLRARFVAGDPELGARFEALIEPVRYPEGGIPAGALKDIRRLKARMESERLPRGADPKLHVKMGRGGLSDTEWTIQLMQLDQAAEVPGLRTTRSLVALDAARSANLVSSADAETIAQAWDLASRIRNATLLWRGRGSDSVPTDSRDAEGVSRILGRAPGAGAELTEDYQRCARRARVVTDRLFYGKDAPPDPSTTARTASAPAPSGRGRTTS